MRLSDWSAFSRLFFFGCRLTTLGAHRFPRAWLRPQAVGGRWGRSLSYGFPGRGRLTRGNVGLDPLRKISARGRPWSQVPCGRPGTTRISLGGHYEPRLNSGARCLGLWYDPDRCARGSHRLAGPQTSELELHWAPGVVHWVHHPGPLVCALSRDWPISRLDAS